MGKSNNRDNKREKFTEPKKNNRTPVIMFAVIVVALVGFIGYQFFAPTEDVNATNNVGGTLNVGAVSYGSSPVEQTEVTNTAENGKVKISKEEVQKNKFVYTEYKKGDKIVPLTAYINPKGRIVVAFSMCEPCRGTRFHVEGDELVCNTCGARWKLTNMAPVSGAPGCLKYAPEEMNYDVDGNFLTMDEGKVSAWVPRV
jgi:uncharacterized protein